MAKGTKICKICGKEYEYCKTIRPAGTFDYHEVACSPEHGAEYFAKVLASRAKTSESTDENLNDSQVEELAEETSVEEIEEEDDFEEEEDFLDFDDDEEDDL